MKKGPAWIMTISLVLMFVPAIIVAWLIGANSISPSFAPPACLGDVGVLRGALLAGIFAFLGAALLGGNVAKTVGSGLLSGVEVTPLMGSLILFISASLIGLGILVKIPIPAVFTVIGSVLGAGLATGAVVNTEKVELLATVWVIAPFVGLAMGFALSRTLRRFLKKDEKSRRKLEILLILIATFAAFAGGANRVGLAMGIVSNSSAVPLSILLLIGGSVIMLGSLVGGPRILNTVSRDYSELGIRRAISALISVGVLLLIATLLGAPLSTNEVLLGSIIGSGLAVGSERVRFKKIAKTASAWVLTLLGSMGIGWGAVSVLTTFF